MVNHRAGGRRWTKVLIEAWTNGLGKGEVPLGDLGTATFSPITNGVAVEKRVPMVCDSVVSIKFKISDCLSLRSGNPKYDGQLWMITSMNNAILRSPLSDHAL